MKKINILSILAVCLLVVGVGMTTYGKSQKQVNSNKELAINSNDAMTATETLTIDTVRDYTSYVNIEKDSSVTLYTLDTTSNKVLSIEISKVNKLNDSIAQIDYYRRTTLFSKLEDKDTIESRNVNVINRPKNHCRKWTY